MIRPEKPSNEAERLAALQRYAVLDTEAEAAYDDLVTILTGICGTPIGAVSLIDAERQWFKARFGLDVAETSRDVSFCAHAILDPGDLLVVEDARADPRFVDNPLVTGDMGLRFYAGAPLITGDGHALGALCVIDRQPRRLSDFQREALRSLSRQVSVLLELRRSSSELRQHLDERHWYEQQLRDYQDALELQNAQLISQTRADPLTGLANRRAFAASLEAELARAKALDTPLSLAMCDIDFFKRINDEYGHPVGDQVLIALADLLRQPVGAEALAARCGGEEFALILPGEEPVAAERICEDLRRRLPELPLPMRVTISIGLAAWRPGDTPESLYGRADAALYAAKRGGRDRVVSVRD